MSIARAQLCSASSSFFGQPIVTNQQLFDRFGGKWTPEKIFGLTGIQERRIWYHNSSANDKKRIAETLIEAGADAARKALVRAGMEASEVEVILFPWTYAVQLAVGNGPTIMKKLGIDRIEYLNVNQACNSFIHAIKMAQMYVQADNKKNVLIVALESFSFGVNPDDPITAILFSNGASAAVFRACHSGAGVLASIIHTDISLSDAVTAPLGTTCLAMPENGGHALMKHGPQAFADVYREVLVKAGLPDDTKALLVPHQANDRMITKCAEIIGLSLQQVSRVIRLTGNTGAASVGIALEKTLYGGTATPGAILVTLAGGAGFQYGANCTRLDEAPYNNNVPNRSELF